ncbi:uncharacterized protein MAM_05562 [Metarhizium album ARSEF 1941]|uniref:Meiotically up-regulated 65 protein n=1 Tax=Metarhizium album (strain ARSEF 1941) TaxID=1081103 RepID=A0A0B2WSL9_METAS|nr:uncharacterized protein MAM_05562 [Metarhizium album ARSEF 1941]KHN96619.1 hypothetical protein MAM_05562 [Metarhizium album ARSEF 1941]
MVKVRSSRRVASLKPSDYDHEIGLVNRDELDDDSHTVLASDVDTRRGSTTSQLPSLVGDSGPEDAPARTEGSRANEHSRHGQQKGVAVVDVSDDSENRLRPEDSGALLSTQPSIEVQSATPDVFNDPTHRIMPKRPQATREVAIDILYENERGAFMCGMALFSSKALGGLDPPAWTNTYHKPSLTNIYTAVVPDPSWEWIWPEWRINYELGVDEGGWEYSFAFSKKFSWHEPKWWNSFVRRRAWIRKRARKRCAASDSPGNLLNSDYFTIRPASSHSSNRRSAASVASSRAASKSSMTRTSIKEVEAPQDIENVESLLSALRASRIDREKREAVKNYLEHAMDLSQLQDEMHEIMSLFVFQASRRQLLSHLMRKYDETARKLEDGDSKDDKKLLERKRALEAAVKHADEEVSKLAYWSDVKHMAERGELMPSVDDHGWYEAHPGLDRSGPRAPNKGKLPESGGFR